MLTFLHLVLETALEYTLPLSHIFLVNTMEDNVNYRLKSLRESRKVG